VRNTLLFTLFGLLLLTSLATVKAQDQAYYSTQGRIFGAELMSPKELAEYRAKMHNLKTWKQRERFRLSHRREMEARANAGGIHLMPYGRVQGQRQGGNSGPSGKGWR
jgi:hypothetical protein